jgi:hypothetical protein
VSHQGREVSSLWTVLMNSAEASGARKEPAPVDESAGEVLVLLLGPVPQRERRLDHDRLRATGGARRRWPPARRPVRGAATPRNANWSPCSGPSARGRLGAAPSAAAMRSANSRPPIGETGGRRDRRTSLPPC